MFNIFENFKNINIMFNIYIILLIIKMSRIKKILLVTALSQELNVIKSEIKKLKIPNLKVSYLSTWMGNYNMILNLTRFLEQNWDFDFVLNIWTCWYKSDYKDFFQVIRIFNFSNKKELLVPHLINFWDFESIFCSEKVVFDSEILWEEQFVDMESFGFELVCDSFSLSRAIFKVPVDKIWTETKNFDFSLASSYLREKIDYKKLFEEILKYLEKIPEKQDFDNYFSEINFTFSQKEIFKKLFFKYKALVSDNFESYFEENKSLQKEKFLKNLENFLDKFTQI